MASAPLMRDSVAVGVISMSSPQPGALTDQQMDLLQTFADQAVIAIQNVRLFNETKEALERQTATAEILKVIASSPSDVQPVFDAIAKSANRLLGGFSTAVFRVVDDSCTWWRSRPPTRPANEALKAVPAAARRVRVAHWAATARGRSPTPRPGPACRRAARRGAPARLSRHPDRADAA